MIVCFEGGPADGDYRYIPEGKREVTAYVFPEPGEGLKEIAYRDTGRFTNHGPVARIFEYVGD